MLRNSGSGCSYRQRTARRSTSYSCSDRQMTGKHRPAEWKCRFLRRTVYSFIEISLLGDLRPLFCFAKFTPIRVIFGDGSRCPRTSSKRSSCRGRMLRNSGSGSSNRQRTARRSTSNSSSDRICMSRSYHQ